MREASWSNLVNNAEECKEEVSHFNGTVPSWLRGNFLRTGPGLFHLPKTSVDSIFDGYAILSKFELNGTEKVAMSAKLLESESLKKAMAAKKPVIAEFCTKSSPDPTKGMLAKLVPSIVPELSDNGNTGLFNIGNNVFACGETCYIHKLSESTLQLKEKYDSSKLLGLEIMSPHPITDEDGTFYNVGISFRTGLKYNFVKIPPVNGPVNKDVLKKAKTIASIPSSSLTHISYIHSFGLTQKFIILIEQPFCVNSAKVFAAAIKKHGECQTDWIDWKGNFRNKFIVLDKVTGKVVKQEYVAKDPFFFFHIVNCYEENDQIVMDIITLKDASFITKAKLSKICAGQLDVETVPIGKRFVLPLSDCSDMPEGVNLVEVKSSASAIKLGSEVILTPEILTAGGLEFPIINDSYQGKKYSYYFATGSFWESSFVNTITKVDVKNKRPLVWKASSRYQNPGEPIFVPDPNGISEDDGVLLSAVQDIRDGHNDFLLLLNARDMTELARAQFQSKVPLGVHGKFLKCD